MNVFDHIKSSIDTLDFFQSELDLTASGKEYKCICPLHDDTDPSFTVYEKDGEWVWHCHGACNTGGDIFDFTEKKYKLDTHDAITAIADRYNIDIEEQRGQYSREIVSKDDARNTAQKVLVEIRRESEKANEFLKSRGISEKTADKFGIGYNDGTLLSRLQEIIVRSDGKPNGQLMHSIGLAVKKSSVTTITYSSFIGAGKLTFPLYYDGRIGHWHLRSADKDKSRNYQIPKEYREEDILFYNQNRINHEEFYIVEGPFDVIALEDRGYKAIATLGTPGKAQIEYLKMVLQQDVDMPDMQKQINIMMDRDANMAGQIAAKKLASELKDFAKVRVYDLDEGVDIDEHLKKGTVSDLESRPVDKTDGPIVVRNGKYFYRSKKELRAISNFTLSREYVHVDESYNRTYKVRITKGSHKSKLFEWDSSDFASSRNLRQWLGSKGDYIFHGGDAELNTMLEFIYNTESPKVVHLRDGYGDMGNGVWLTSNCVISEGRIIPINDDKIIPVEKDDLPNIISTMHDIKYKIPDESYDIPFIIDSMLKYYPRPWVWMSLGFASAMYFHNYVREEYGEFPILALYGPTMSGKTSLAVIIASLLGAGRAATPSSSSTEKGITRMLATLRGIPVIVNESDRKKVESLVQDVYDRNVYTMAKRTTDNRFRQSQIRTSMILTSETIPRKASVQNRMLLLDFRKIKTTERADVTSEFESWKANGVNRSMNSTWLKEISKYDPKDGLIEDIEHCRKIFVEADRKSDPRTIYNYSVIFGCFRFVARNMGIPKILEDLGIKAYDIHEVLKEFRSGSNNVKHLNSEDRYCKHFFHLVERCNMERLLGDYLRFDSDAKGKFVMFCPTHLFSKIQEIDRRGGNQLDGIGLEDIRAEIKNTLQYEDGKRMRTVDIEGKRKNTSAIKVYLSSLEEQYGITFATLEDHE